MNTAVDPARHVRAFLHCATPAEWISAAVGRLDLLLMDHANCEKKAAATALALMQRYGNDAARSLQLSRLAREELRHFEQVITLMRRRGLAPQTVSASRYATRLREQLRPRGLERLLDTLLISAIIEARSCERFSALAPALDDELAVFYRSLLASEARHFEIYLQMAQPLATPEQSAERLQELLAFECALILSEDGELRFHSGIPRNS
jgi:tRNA-(ms[2]io[6]A)-hydroxylase